MVVYPDIYTSITHTNRDHPSVRHGVCRVDRRRAHWTFGSSDDGVLRYYHRTKCSCAVASTNTHTHECGLGNSYFRVEYSRLYFHRTADSSNPQELGYNHSQPLPDDCRRGPRDSHRGETGLAYVVQCSRAVATPTFRIQSTQADAEAIGGQRVCNFMGGH